MQISGDKNIQKRKKKKLLYSWNKENFHFCIKIRNSLINMLKSLSCCSFQQLIIRGIGSLNFQKCQRIFHAQNHTLYTSWCLRPRIARTITHHSLVGHEKKRKKKKEKLRVPRKLASFVQKALMVVQINFIVPFFPNVTWGESMNTMKMVINFRKIFRLFIKSHYIMITLHND